MEKLKDPCKGASRFYGNGTVYISDGSQVQKLLEHNFDIESLGPDGAEVWICDGPAVALSYKLRQKSAVKALKLIIRKIESGAQ
jgi:hypothetical protein